MLLQAALSIVLISVLFLYSDAIPVGSTGLDERDLMSYLCVINSLELIRMEDCNVWVLVYPDISV